MCFRNGRLGTNRRKLLQGRLRVHLLCCVDKESFLDEVAVKRTVNRKETDDQFRDAGRHHSRA